MVTDLLLILFLGAGLGWTAVRFGVPAAMAQVLLGLILGPSILGWIAPNPVLEFIGDLGVVLLLGMAGLQLGFKRLSQAGWAGLWVALLGIVFSLGGGYGFAIWWGSPNPEALYVGTALTATSIAITAQVLQQFGLIRRKVGQVVIAAAVIDDVLALFLLAVAHGLLSGALAPTGIASSILLAALALAVIFALCRLFAHGAAGWLFGSHPVFSLVFVVLVILMFGWVTQQLGYSLVVGGFFAGLGLAGGLKQTTREQLHRHIEKLVLVLSPFFFVLIGSRAEWGVLGDPGMVILLIGLLVVALVGKTLGGVLGAVGTRDIASRLLIGVGMAPRGEVALVIATLGFQQGHISHHVLVALILMTIGAALLAPVLMIPLARYQQQAAN